MVCCECSSRSGCQTSRCECKLKNKKCTSNCQCSPNVCTNRGGGCSCSSKSRCVTNGCECRAEGKSCNPEICGCDDSVCENLGRRVAESKTVKMPASTLRTPLHQVDSASAIVIEFPKTSLKKSFLYSIDDDKKNPDFGTFVVDLKSNLTTTVTHKRDKVIEICNGVDRYTSQDARKIENPEVDHIVECQIVGHAAAKVVYNSGLGEKLTSPLKKAFHNIMPNYNVTSMEINRSKGQLVRSYLTDKKYSSIPFLAHVINEKSDRALRKYIEPVNHVMLETGPTVVNEIKDVRRDDGHVSGHSYFEDISESLSELLDKMLIDTNSTIRNRSQKY